jgi:hypothetical protein
MFTNFIVPRKSCRLWDNVEKYGGAGQATDDSIIRRMCIACWIRKATNTPSEGVLGFSTATMVTRTRYNFTFVLFFLSICPFTCSAFGLLLVLIMQRLWSAVHTWFINGLFQDVCFALIYLFSATAVFDFNCLLNCICIYYIYRVSQEERTILREGVP